MGLCRDVAVAGACRGGESQRAVRGRGSTENLGDNARDHARSVVALELSVVGDQAQIRVTDDGSGIPSEDRERVFERFTRVDDSRRRSAAGGGTGLGLSIARQIVRDHRGSVAAQSRPDGESGTVFLVVLPREEPHDLEV
ncbi:MAG: hypothetical protein EPN48_17855 [Microbacteriaceae bacterium]|nr:MAG: hypothetical protein EPN48_17855 [Microbacteriaceae bacterium]